MPEVIIKYKKPETLKILKGLAKYFDFKISKEKPEAHFINGVKIIPADKNADMSDLSDLFTKNNINASELRKQAWKRK